MTRAARGVDEDAVVRCARAHAAACALSLAEPTLSGIAKAARCSRNSVRGYLDEAVRRGYIELRLNLPKNQKLSWDLKQMYGLDRAIIPHTQTRWHDQESIRAALALELVRCFETLCQDINKERPPVSTIRIGIDGGQTLSTRDVVPRHQQRTTTSLYHSFAQHANHLRLPPLTYEIVPLLFGPLEGSRYSASVIAALMAAKLELAELRVAVKDTFKISKKRLEIVGEHRRRIELLVDMPKDAIAPELNIVLVGLGSPRAGLMKRELELAGGNKSHFGDICNLGYDANGRPVDALSRARAVLLSLRDLQTLTTKAATPVVVAAGGRDKVEAIHVALKCHYVSILITDEETAQYLLGNRHE